MGLIAGMEELKSRGFIVRTEAHKASGFLIVKKVGDYECALKQFMHTTGLLVKVNTDPTESMYERRYYFPHPDVALSALIDYDDVTKHPAGGYWIKCKGTFEGKPIDLLNPEWSKRYERKDESA